MRVITFLAVFVVSSLVLAQEPSSEKTVILSSTTNPDGTYSDFRVTPARLRQTPKWTGVGEPPLSISDASLAATAFVKKKHSELLKHLDLHSISLNHASHRSIRNRWFYCFTFDIRESAGDPLRQGAIYVVLLFDGSIVEPKTKKK